MGDPNVPDAVQMIGPRSEDLKPVDAARRDPPAASATFASSGISNVEEIVGLLGEAAEIEHGLMCCYLYAMFGLKTREDDGLSPSELAAVRRWRSMILSVAIEEMAHLGLVSNIACALGVRPHFGRQNFPVGPGYHPASITVALAPFDRDTLDHFIFLERPEDLHENDGGTFAPQVSYARGSQGKRLTPVARDYATVGQLYQAITEGLRELCARDDETAIFCGSKAGQVGPDLMPLPGMTTVGNLATALQAIEAIVQQGEGAADHRDDSHYARFLSIRSEYKALSAANPTFAPSRPVARNPVMRRPPVPEGRVFVDMPEAARVLDLANALYNHMLRCLIQAYGRTEADHEAQRTLIDTGVALMGLMTPVAEALTTLPASLDRPGVNAGMTFATMRFYQPFIEGPSEWRLLSARTRELAYGVRNIGELIPDAERIATRLDRLAASLGDHRSGVAGSPASSLDGGASIPATDAAGGATQMTAQPLDQLHRDAPPTQGGVEVAEGREITILFDGKRCIHARHCVTGAPGVFKANTPGEWLFPDAADTETLVAIAQACPSGAIQYRRHDNRPDEVAPPVNLANVRENGPLAVRGVLSIAGLDVGKRATLCRCGLSSNKPFCDGSHVAGAFVASGEPATGDVHPLTARDGTLLVEPQRNGPLMVTGNLELCAGTGRAVARTTTTRLCRCGHSGNKPFCDNSHLRVGFEAD